MLKFYKVKLRTIATTTVLAESEADAERLAKNELAEEYNGSPDDLETVSITDGSIKNVGFSSMIGMRAQCHEYLLEINGGNTLMPKSKIIAEIGEHFFNALCEAEIIFPIDGEMYQLKDNPCYLVKQFREAERELEKDPNNKDLVLRISDLNKRFDALHG